MTTNRQWDVVELEFAGPQDGNPFVDVQFAADFTLGETKVHVPGFYDGAGRYLVRFMPTQVGTWAYRTTSNATQLDGHGSRFEVQPADAHGPVRVSGSMHFKHADGTPFIPMGTTIYALPHQSADLIETTMQSLAAAPFNKLRLCVFPKHFKYNHNEPEFYPFPVLKAGHPATDATHLEADAGWEFDKTRFEPAFFRHLEQLIARLGQLGIEADLILFHPYDRWGFSRMSDEEDAGYLRYIVARLAAHSNVWWSMANEFDVMPAKTDADWQRLIETVVNADPYGHLLSVHNCFRFFDHSNPLVTHVSVQRDNTANVALWHAKYGKPVIVDECGYEGDLSDLWGNLSGQEMMHRVWNGVLNGGYVTHGETFRNPEDIVFWSKGGTLRGESVARIAFLAETLKRIGAADLEPQASVQRLILLAGGPENLEMSRLQAAGVDAAAPAETRMVLPWFHTIGRPHDVYLAYFGGQQPSEFVVPVPHGEEYRATLLDAWQMTRTVIAERAERGQLLQFPAKPYQAVLLERVTPASPASSK